ncbi:DEAD/DEAH box helicase [Enterococcus sp. AZ007]|uniref:DEAD/DEAH box helicase n=1 Tax=Enterococcus sp. AZ007 TaxID=2774839 RepID=UPI003F21C70F
MNKKEDILNGWITIEQLSEGNLDKSLRKFRESEDIPFNDLFTRFMQEQIEKLKKEKEYPKKYGFVIYFDIFSFQEIMTILRKRYGIKAAHEETTFSKKFTFALYFDKELEFVAEKLFFTISGYIRYKKDLPKDFEKAENDLREDLKKQFEDKDFNQVLSDLLKQYRVDLSNCGYDFVKDLDGGDANLHSFFIEDLKRAQAIQTENLDRYFSGFSGERYNLDGNKHSPNFQPAIIQEILQPQFYPLGRFPSNSDYALSLMQQVAVNLTLHEANTVRSVNGPPGTGKTTILKDIFADLIVQQAKDICDMKNKYIKGTLVYFKQGKLGLLPTELASKNSVVASSNNGAVQNIVNELPLQEKAAQEFIDQLLEADYFTNVANTKFDLKKNRSETTKNVADDKLRWGTFSLEGGKADNVKLLLLHLKAIETYLNEEYCSDPDVYQDFLELYETVLKKRNEAQEYFRQIQDLAELRDIFEQGMQKYARDLKQKEEKLERLEISTQQKVEHLQEEKGILEETLTSIALELKKLKEEEKQIKAGEPQKPSFFLVKRLFNRTSTTDYLEKIELRKNQLEILKEHKRELTDNQKSEKNTLDALVRKKSNLERSLQEEQSSLEKWQISNLNNLKKNEKKIAKLEQSTQNSTLKELDFSVSYDELQDSNPWFTKEYRIMQSELFIAALKVRKEFIFENRKHLKGAMNIWKYQYKHYAKENGQEIISQAWHWINFVIPVISTTFASFGRMFKHLPTNTIGNLFIDEAGQALPQASVGAIFRSKKVLAVGDPFQIKPVLTLDSSILSLIAQYYQVDETFISLEASTQTLVDAASQFGFEKSKDEWIGIPLWVHRRCAYPMFTISNAISYDELMVQGLKGEQTQGKSYWFDITGKANDKFVKEQAEFLTSRINDHIRHDPTLKDQIYVVSPFKNVAYKLATILTKNDFVRKEKGKAINVGTVHTFQGKEAKIVYFVLGADESSRGAANWAVTEANITNVAATRAVKEFYIIGDKSLYSSLNSEVSNKTISIIDEYNKEVKPIKQSRINPVAKPQT